MDPQTSQAEPPAPMWKEIPGCEAYEVSTDGQIRNKKSGQIRVQDKNSRGYYRIRVQRGGEYIRLMTHRCVAKAFIPNPQNKPIADHIDGNPLNNRVENLRWTTASENMLNQKIRKNKTQSRYRNIIKQGKKYKWKITVNGQIHTSQTAFETEELAHADFKERVKSLSEYISIPLPIPAV